MTNEQKVRVDRLERYLITDKDKIYTRVRVGDLDTAISLIKQLESEKEERSKVRTFKRCFSFCKQVTRLKMLETFI